MFVSLPPPQVIQNLKMSNFVPQIKQRFNLHFDSNFVSCSNEGEFHGHIRFFHLNLLVSNVFILSTKLLQINPIIVNIFSGIIIVTVNI